MSFDDVYLVTPNRTVAAPAQVAHAERLLGTRLPRGYADFVTRFGDGDYCTFVRVLLPERIVAEYGEFRQRWREYFFWDEGDDVLPKERVLESIIVADTMQGDELIFHPDEPDRLFVLPRHDERIFEAGNGLAAALAWLCDSGELTAPIGAAWFESRTGRRRLRFGGPGDVDAVREALLGLGMHHHARHGTDDDGFVEMFVPAVQGTVSLFAHRGEVEVFVSHDADTDPAALRRIGDRLERSGLAPRPIPAAEAG